MRGVAFAMFALVLVVVAALATDRADALAWRTPQAVPGTATASGQIAIGATPAGRAALAWVDGSGAEDRLRVALRSGRTGAWSRAGRLGADTAPSIGQVAVGGGPDGSLAVGWVTSDGVVRRANTAEPPAAPDARASRSLFIGPVATEPRIEISPQGHTSVVWASAAGRFAVAVRLAGGEWSAPHQLPGDVSGVALPRVAFDRSGSALVVWEDRVGCRILFADRDSLSGAWSPPGQAFEGCRQVRRPGRLGSVTDVAVGASGHAAIAFSAISDSEDLVLFRRAPGGVWDGGVPVREGDSPVVGDVVVDPDGGVVVVSSQRGVLEASELEPGRGAVVRSRGLFAPTGPDARPGSTVDGAAELDAFSVLSDGRGTTAVYWSVSWTLRNALYASIRGRNGRYSAVSKIGTPGSDLLRPAALDGPRSLTAAWARGDLFAPSEPRRAALVARLAPTALRCRGRSATIVGTAGRDVIFGSSAPDVVAGLGGPDRVIASHGNDTVCGGRGPDRMEGGAHRDTLVGGRGDDALLGERARDLLDGGPGRDVARGGPGRDRCVRAVAIGC